MSARHTALTALIACRKAGAWSDSVLDAHLRREKLDSRDAALATRLCYGVLQNRQLLDFYLAAFSKRRLTDLQPVVLDILRLAAYQLLVLDKIPDAAAVNEAVEQAKRSANPQAAGYVNGVLRGLLRGPLPQVPAEDLATRYSHPAELVELFKKNVPAEMLEPMLAENNRVPAACLQVNTQKTDVQTLLGQLEGAQTHPWLPNCVSASKLGDPEALETFVRGLFWVQDPAAKLAVLALDLQPGMRLLDACAAPGGKTFAAAVAMAGKGRVMACDIHENKLQRIVQGARRLELNNIQTALLDASAPAPELCEAYDAVLLDVPCSGLGVIRKKPDVRYRDLTAIQGLPAVQTKILENRCSAVKKGGILLYATCTILSEENQQVVLAFLNRHPEFALEPIAVSGLPIPENNGMLTLYPGGPLNTDGFFLAKLRRAL